MNSIFARRSIRVYTGQPIPNDDLNLCIKAAMYAPSAGNEQAWEFIITRARENLTQLGRAHPYGKALFGAAAAVTVCGNRSRLKFPQEYWVEDCSAAAQNLMLQAQELGIGSVWLAVYPCEDRVEAVSRELHLPSQVVPLCIIAMGYPGETRVAEERYRPEKIHLERWNSDGV